MKSIVLLVGLPGSGKSHMCDDLKTKGYYILDDIMDLQTLPPLGTVDKLVVADVNFCRPEILEVAKEELIRRYKVKDIELIYFENSPQKCLINVKHRADGRRVKGMIELLSKCYRPPATALQIWQKPKV